MKICGISDIHGNLIPYPSEYWKGLEECEVLFICGDIMPLNIQFNIPKSEKWLIKEFKPWAESLPVEKVIFIAGNHDAWFERKDPQAHDLFPRFEKVSYLKHEGYEHLSLNDNKIYKVFGTPYCHIFGNWPFMRSDILLEKYYSQIPEDVDVLISHDSPSLCGLGTIYQTYPNREAGNLILTKHVERSKPKYLFTGHIHSGEHILQNNVYTRMANCSILDENYEITYNPLILKI